MESGPSSRASVVLGQWKTKTKPEKKRKTRNQRHISSINEPDDGTRRAALEKKSIGPLFFFRGLRPLLLCHRSRDKKRKKMETKDNGEKLGKQQLSSGRHPPGQRTKSAFSFFYPPPKRKNINSDLKLGKEKATYKSMSLDA